MNSFARMALRAVILGSAISLLAPLLPEVKAGEACRCARGAAAEERSLDSSGVRCAGAPDGCY